MTTACAEVRRRVQSEAGPCCFEIAAGNIINRGELIDSSGAVTMCVLARIAHGTWRHKMLKQSLLCVFAAQLVIRCSGVFHGASAFIWSDVLNFYLSLVYSFCTTVLRTALPLLPLLIWGFIMSAMVHIQLASKVWRKKDPYIFTLISHLSHLFITVTPKSGGGIRSWCLPYFSTSAFNALWLSCKKKILILIFNGNLNPWNTLFLDINTL